MERIVGFLAGRDLLVVPQSQEPKLLCIAGEIIADLPVSQLSRTCLLELGRVRALFA